VARPRKLPQLPGTPDEHLAMIQRLAAIACTMEEIGAVTGLSVDTLERRYAEPIKKGRELGKASLRRELWRLAMNGNLGAQIWLSKQHLGMREQHEFSGPGGGAVPVQIVNDVAGPIPAGGGNGAKAGGHD
jgi:hypothetical protein